MKLYQVAVSSIKGLPRQHKIALASTSLHDLDKELEAVKDEEHKHKVASGDTLGSIFSQYGLPVSDMYALIDANKSIQHLKVGQQMEWSLDSDGRVKDFSIVRDRKTTDTFTLTKKGYKYKAVEIAGVIKPVILHGKVTGSFYNSARNAGLSPTQIKTVVKALQWKFNLGSGASRGDRFAISLDREFIDGKPVNMGDVNAFFYKHGNQTYFIQRFDDDQFFDQSGRSLNRSFRRYPTAKRYRISSSFNPHRRHPITRRISHLITVPILLYLLVLLYWHLVMVLSLNRVIIHLLVTIL